MSVTDPHTRREFLAAAGAAVAASTAPAWALPAGSKRRYALVGTGIRGIISAKPWAASTSLQVMRTMSAPAPFNA